MTSIATRLDMHFTAMAAIGAVAGIGAIAQNTQAAIVSSGPVSIAVPNNIDGVYLNVVTGASGAVGPSGWDLNPYSAAAGQFNLWSATTNTWLDNAGVFVIAGGTLIDGTGTFSRPGGGTNVGTQVTLNASNLFGFQFTNEAAAGQNQFGWIRIAFGATAADRTIVEYAYENTGAGINAGVVPAPTAGMGLLAMGGLGLLGRRRK